MTLEEQNEHAVQWLRHHAKTIKDKTGLSIISDDGYVVHESTLLVAILSLLLEDRQ